MKIGTLTLSDREFYLAVGVAVVGVGLTLYAAKRAGKAVGEYVLNDAVNLTSERNLAHTAAGAIVGHENLDTGLNYFFAKATLANPLASEQSKKEARNYLALYHGG